MDIHVLNSGYCRSIKKLLLQHAPWQCCKVPALCALIIHPDEGPILFDTGYSDYFFKETCKFPFSIYAKLTPATLNENDTLAKQLEALNLKPADIQKIIISHFHADHIAGLRDFPNASFIASKQAYDKIKNKTGLSALLSGFVPNLLPDDLEDRCQWIEAFPIQPLSPIFHPFQSGYALDTRGKLIAVSLPGHSLGQMGLIALSNTNPHFFVADSCWHSDAYQTLHYPSKLSRWLHYDYKAYVRTLTELNQLYKGNSDIKIIPSHCNTYWEDTC